MFWPLYKAQDAAEAEIASANHRSCGFSAAISSRRSSPQSEIPVGRWEICTLDRLEFSGVAYYFGRNLQKELGTPVGFDPVRPWWHADRGLAAAGSCGRKARTSRESAKCKTISWDDHMSKTPVPSL